MKIVISQPMYLPWPGLFDQIKNCDVFIHYDDATLPQGRSFISRVQVKNNDTLGWMTIPIKKSKLPINQILIDNENNWKKNHIKRIKKSLENTSFFNIAFELIQDLEKVEFNNISELNIYYIEKISRFLGFNTEFRISSDYKLDLQATEKLIQICKINHATKYITGHGAINYICHESFEKAVRQWPEIMETYLMTGDSDYLLRVVVSDLPAYEKFLMERLTKLPGISSIKSSFALKEILHRTALPIKV